MKARPAFSVEIKKADRVLAFGCSFLPSEGEKDARKRSYSSPLIIFIQV